MGVVSISADDHLATITNVDQAIDVIAKRVVAIIMSEILLLNDPIIYLLYDSIIAFIIIILIARFF